jgi:hypothetical protein
MIDNFNNIEDAYPDRIARWLFEKKKLYSKFEMGRGQSIYNFVTSLIKLNLAD